MRYAGQPPRGIELKFLRIDNLISLDVSDLYREIDELGDESAMMIIQ